MTNARLTVELVPRTSWFENVRKVVNRSTWDKLRAHTLAQANNCCEICSSTHRLECHEVFEYDDSSCVQTLVRLQCLCKKCHGVKHLGLAFVQEREQPLLYHLQTINGWEFEQTRDYVMQVFEQWQQRSSVKWQVNLEWLHNEHLCAAPQR